MTGPNPLGSESVEDLLCCMIDPRAREILRRQEDRLAALEKAPVRGKEGSFTPEEMAKENVAMFLQGQIRELRQQLAHEREKPSGHGAERIALRAENEMLRKELEDAHAAGHHLAAEIKHERGQLHASIDTMAADLYEIHRLYEGRPAESAADAAKRWWQEGRRNAFVILHALYEAGMFPEAPVEGVSSTSEVVPSRIVEGIQLLAALRDESRAEQDRVMAVLNDIERVILAAGVHVTWHGHSGAVAHLVRQRAHWERGGRLLASLLSSLPECDSFVPGSDGAKCHDAATRSEGRGRTRYCDAHGAGVKEYPRAQPVRDAEAWLAEEAP
jgi:hypothetical protein